MLKSPYVYFGGKSTVAGMVWERLGDTTNFIEPFFGSGAVTLSRPHYPFKSTRIETVNDAEGMISNFWRAVQFAPDETARFADWPVNECDLHARHLWLRSKREDLTARLMADPDYFDAKIAGYWVWGMACWIGGGWCGDYGNGPWGIVENDEGEKVFGKLEEGAGVSRQRPHLGNAGQGVVKGGIYDWFSELSERMRNVRVCCGEWDRICGPSPTTKLGLTGVFLDPPYDLDIRSDGCYATDRPGVAQEVLAWCIENGENPLFRIALCGYAGEHDTLAEEHGWDYVAWKARGGFGSQGKNVDTGKENSKKERIWFSPHCLKPNQQTLF